MKIALVHNEYGKFSGEEQVVRQIKTLLINRGHEVALFLRSSAEIETMPLGRTRAFFNGIYSFSAIKAFRAFLAREKPDLVHIHNLFPFISPAILPECTRNGIPVVMTLHNYRLVCPNGMHMVNGKICEKCLGGREQWCLINNCEGHLMKSLGYALRNATARKFRFFLDHVDHFAALTAFQKQRMVAEGYPAEKISIIPNMMDDDHLQAPITLGQFVGYVGRVSPEKGFPTLLAAARACPEIPFKVAGSYDKIADLPRQAPPNLSFVGHLQREPLKQFFASTRILVLCSVWFEGFPMTVVEAMGQGKTIVSSRIGGLPEIVEDGITGRLFQPGNSNDLAEKIRSLWQQPERCLQMGRAGREKAAREYSVEAYYQRLIKRYQSLLSRR